MEFGQGQYVWKNTEASRSGLIGVEAVIENSDEIVITTTHDVRIQNIQTMTCSSNWMYRPDSNLALKVPAIKHAGLKKMFSARGQNKNILVSWACTDNSLEHAKTKQVDHEIDRLYVDSSLDNHVIVIFVDGSFTLIDENLNPVLDLAEIDSHGKVQFAACFTRQKIVVLCVIARNEHEEYILRLFSIDLNDNGCYHATLSCESKLIPPTSETKLAKFAIHSNPTVLSIIWECGQWQKLYLERRNVSRFDTKMHLLSQMCPTKKRRRICDFASVGNSFSYIACVSGNSIYGWNADFGVEVARTDIDLESKKDSVLSVKSTSNGAHCIVLFKNSVLVVSVESKVSGLKGILGCAANSTQTPPVSVTIDLNDNELFQNGLTNIGCKLTEKSLREQRIIDKLISVAHEYQSFNKIMDDYMNSLSRKRKDCNAPTMDMPLSLHFIVTVCRVCISNENWHALRVLIRSNQLSARRVPNLIPTLIKHKKESLLKEALLHLLDVPESMCVSILKFFLRCSPTEKDNTKATTKKVGLNDTEKSICLVISRGRNLLFLQNAVRELSVEEVCLLLSLLRKLYAIRNAEITCSTLDIVPPMQVVLEWFAILMDIHFQSLVFESLTKDYIASLLLDWNSRITKEISTYSQFAALHGELANVFTVDNNPIDALCDYSVDTLYF